MIYLFIEFESPTILHSFIMKAFLKTKKDWGFPITITNTLLFFSLVSLNKSLWLCMDKIVYNNGGNTTTCRDMDERATRKDPQCLFLMGSTATTSDEPQRTTTILAIHCNPQSNHHHNPQHSHHNNPQTILATHPSPPRTTTRNSSQPSAAQKQLCLTHMEQKPRSVNPLSSKREKN